MSIADNEKGNRTPEAKERPAITLWAGLGSLLWVLATVAFVYLSPLPKDCTGPVRCMSLNEWGDFIAGVSAPLAFLWLVVAVYIQSHELSEQRAELRLTRKEFEQNRRVLEGQAEEARRQAEYIGKQTELLTKQVESEDYAQLEAYLEGDLNELSALVAQHLHNHSVVHGTRSNGLWGPAVFLNQGHDRDGWIFALANYLHRMDQLGLEAPYRVPPESVYAVTRVYELCQQLEETAEALGSNGVNKLLRLRIPEIRAFLENNLSDRERSADDDSSEAHGELGFRLPRPAR